MTPCIRTPAAQTIPTDFETLSHIKMGEVVLPGCLLATHAVVHKPHLDVMYIQNSNSNILNY